MDLIQQFRNQVSFISTIYVYRVELGATSIEKIPKISASDRNIRDPSPLFEKGPYRQKHEFFVPNRNYNVHLFFNISTPSPISSESQTSPILSIEVAPIGQVNSFAAHCLSVI